LFYRVGGKAKLLGFGGYPVVGLKLARERREAAKELLARGIDPGEHKKEMKKVSAAESANCFEAVAREWHLKQRTRKNPGKEANWTERHAGDVMARLEKNVFPYLGQALIVKLKPAEVLAVLQRIELRQAFEVAHQVSQIIGQN
jgi:hypothetical protein